MLSSLPGILEALQTTLILLLKKIWPSVRNRERCGELWIQTDHGNWRCMSANLKLDDCGYTRKSAHPLFGERIKCTARGWSFTRLWYFASQLQKMAAHALTTACCSIIVQPESGSTATLEWARWVGTGLSTASIVVVALIDIYSRREQKYMYF